MGVAKRNTYSVTKHDFPQAKEGFSLEQNDLIQRIIATEHQAQAITEHARAEHEHMDEHMESELEALRLRYQQEADNYLESLRQQAESESALRMENLAERLEKKLAQIESIYSTQKDNWVEAIFQRIVGKDGG